MSVIVPKYVYSRKKVFETPTSGTDQESKYIIYPDYHKTMETKKEHTHFEEVYLKSEGKYNFIFLSYTEFMIFFDFHGLYML